MINRATHIILAAMLLMALATTAQVPPRPNPPRLVNDLAGVLGDTHAMEESLEAFAIRTSNQIVVVTLNDLGTYDKAMMAYQIGQQWGVGGSKNNNGIVVLIKPKTPDSKGEAFIAPGYGLEGGLTDAFCTRVVNREMIPHFKENDYNGGVWATLQVLMSVSEGEYSEQEYLDNEDDDDEWVYDLIAYIIIFIVLFLYCYHKYGNGGGGINTPSTGTWGGSTFSGWSGGSGSSGWGGSSGGWGGFGGGSFGGGGGGGSW